MTVSVAIEIEAGGASVGGASAISALGRAAQGGAGKGNAAVNGTATAASAESFGSRWRSMLGAMGAEHAESGARDTQDAEFESAGTENATAENAARTLANPRLAVSGPRGELPVQARAGEEQRGATLRPNAMPDAHGSGSDGVSSPQLTAAENVADISASGSGVAGTAEISSRPSHSDSDGKPKIETGQADSTPAAAVTIVAPVSVTAAVPVAAAGDFVDTQLANAGSSLSFLTHSPVHSSPAAPATSHADATTGAIPAVAVRSPKGQAGSRAVHPVDGSDGTAVKETAADVSEAEGSSATERFVPMPNVPSSVDESAVLAGANPGSGHALPGSSGAAEISGANTAETNRASQLESGQSSSADPGQTLPAATAGSPGADPSPAQLVSHLKHGTGAGDAGASAVHGAAVQPYGGADAVMLARGPGGGAGEPHALNGAPTATGGISAATGAGETFASLDAPPPGGPTWIHAGAQQAEAGFEDPALGWVGIRADLSGGGVHATIVPGSAEAAQALGGHLAGLNSHLAAEQIPVTLLSMAAGFGRESLGSEQGAMQQGTGQQGSGQGAEQRGPYRSSTDARGDGPSVSRDLSSASDLPGQDGSAPRMTGFSGKGTRISVMA